MIFVKKSEKNTCGLELLTSTKDTKLIINQTIKGIKSVEVEMTFEPPWTQDLMSDEAKLELGIL